MTLGSFDGWSVRPAAERVKVFEPDREKCDRNGSGSLRLPIGMPCANPRAIRWFGAA